MCVFCSFGEVASSLNGVHVPFYLNFLLRCLICLSLIYLLYIVIQLTIICLSSDRLLKYNPKIRSYRQQTR